MQALATIQTTTELQLADADNLRIGVAGMLSHRIQDVSIKVRGIGW